MAKGHIPKPPMMERHTRGVPGQSAYANGTVRQGNIKGSVHHTMVGFLYGTDTYFRSPSALGLTDYGIGGPWDGASGDGVIIEWIAPDATTIPFANGGVGTAVPPYGDGARFVSAFGIDPAVNGWLRSIETSDGGQADRDKGGRQIESLAFLTAWIHAEQAGQTVDTFDWQLHHREFGGDHQACPGAWIINNVDYIQTRAKEIMRAYQAGAKLAKPLLITYPPGWAGGVIAQPGGSVPVPIDPPPSDKPIVYAPGIDSAVCAIWFGALLVNGKSYAFDPNGPVSKVWLEHGLTTGAFPRLLSVRTYQDSPTQKREYFGFEGGLVIFRTTGEPTRVLTKAAA